LDEKSKDEKNVTEALFSRTKNVRGKSVGRTNTTAQQPREVTNRPASSQSIGEKVAYFDEFMSKKDVLKDLKMMSHIGKGAFSIVSLAVGRDNKQSFAIKAYEKIDALDWNRLACIKREIRHLRSLDSSRVVKLHDLAREHKKLYLIMENAGKQSLGGLLRKEKILT
jgi:serine/threonine protein kinase